MKIYEVLSCLLTYECQIWSVDLWSFLLVAFILSLFPLPCHRSQILYPQVVAAHPQEPFQFAVGLNDGTVKVVEPTESEGKWGVSPPVDNGMLNGRTASSSATSSHTPDQVQRWKSWEVLYMYKSENSLFCVLQHLFSV